jgi:hypothetical protein
MLNSYANRQSNAKTRALRASALLCCRRSGNGQQVIEYAVLISAIITALLFMYMYGRRGLQAAIKASADQIGPQSQSEPLAGAVVTTGNSTTTTAASDMSQVNKIGEERYYNYQSISTTQGVSETRTQSY